MSPHIARLREAIGHEVIQLPSVSILAVDDETRVLLVRHANTGVWGIVGGAIELDEDPADAARREALEETGVEVELRRLLGVFGGPQYRLAYPNGDITSYVAIAYEATVASGTPEPDYDEVTEVRWFDRAALAAAELHPWARALLRDLGLVDPHRDVTGKTDRVCMEG